MPAGDGANFERQFRGGGQRVTPRVHRCRSRMSLLPVKRDGVALHAFGAEHDTKGQAELFEHGPLLDVQLEIGGSVVPFTLCLREAVDFDTAAAQSVLQANAVFVGSAAVGFDRIRASEGGGA